MPVATSRAMRDIYPEGFNRGFTETFGRYGMLLDRLAMGEANGFIYPVSYTHLTLPTSHSV